MAISLSSTGDIIAMYMEDNDIKIIDVANEARVSLKTVYRIIKGETPLNAKVAIAIEKLIPGVEASYLMSYDSKYILEKAKLAKMYGIKSIKETIVKFKVDKLYPNIKDDGELMEICKSIYGDNVFDDNLPYLHLNDNILNLNFSIAKNEDRNASIAWVNTAFYECINQSNELLNFDKKKFDSYFDALKQFSAATSKELTDFNIRQFCKMVGINYYRRPKIINSRVKGISFVDNNNHVYILMSDLFRSVENDWLTFIHECIHIKNNDYKREIDNTKKNEFFVDKEVKEFFLGDQIERLNDSNIAIDDLRIISNKTKTPFGIVCVLFSEKTNKFAEVEEYIHRY